MLADATPWSAMLKVAANLGLAPEIFWRTSVREWRALVAPPASDVLSRPSFEALSAQFPDQA